MNETRHQEHQIPRDLAGQRADTVVAGILAVSRTKAAGLIGAGCVTHEGRTLVKSDVLERGTLIISQPSEQPAEQEILWKESLQVKFEDDHVVVINKPAGVAAHASPGWSGPTVPGQLAAAGIPLARVGPAEREGIVHRLDVGTTGLMVVAKTPLAYTRLKAAFKARDVEKIYHALAQGHIDPTEGTIDAPIGRHPGATYKFAVTAEGKPSITHYDTLEMMPAASLLEVRLETGRTHQIRVHAAAMRHPLVGDLTYGADPTLAARLDLERQWLHAVRLSFTHPATGETVTVASEYPSDLAAALEVLRL